MSTTVHYGDTIFLTVSIENRQVPLSGETSCDAWYPSTRTPLAVGNYPDSFQIFDVNYTVPKDGSGNPLPVLVGEVVTIYNVTRGMWWKQAHGYCLLDTSESAFTSPFLIGSADGSPGGSAIQAAPWGSGSSFPGGITLIQDVPGSGKRGSGLTVLSSSGMVAVADSSQHITTFTLWTPPVSSSFGAIRAPILRTLVKPDRCCGETQLKIFVLFGLLFAAGAVLKRQYTNKK